MGRIVYYMCVFVCVCVNMCVCVCVPVWMSVCVTQNACTWPVENYSKFENVNRVLGWRLMVYCFMQTFLGIT